MDSLLIAGIIVIIIVSALLIAAYMFRNTSSFSLDIGGQTPRASGGADTSPEKGFRVRLLGFAAIVAGIFALILARLWSMQLLSSEDYIKQAENNRIRTVSTEAPRGRILDCKGVELVTNRSSIAITAVADVADDRVEVQLLANLLGMPMVAALRKIQSENEGAQSARTVATDVTQRTVAILEEHAYVFPGVDIEERTARTYPQGDMACQVLGYTGNITQEQVSAASDESGGSVSYELGDTVGQSGIEYQYESVLQGIRGEQTVYVDADGNVVEYSSSVAPQAGSDVMLTIDATIQQAAEEGLDHAIEMGVQHGNESCSRGALIVLNAKNGEVLAMASAPRFTPSSFIGGISTDDWNEISSDDAGYPLMNRAVSGLYPSASTIKPLSTFAGLNYGMATMDSKYYCTGWWTGFGEAYGKYCWNHDGHGTMDVRTGITYSCDVVFYEIAKSFFQSDDDEGLQETYRRWGLGETMGIDLPTEEKGRVPDAEWKWNYFTTYSDDERSWQGGDLTNLVIGQGDLLVTPLQMACIYMGIANRGTIWRPHLLKAVQSQTTHEAVVEYSPEKVIETTEQESYFDLVHEALVDVIYVEDAAIAAHFTNLSVKVAGKTGTGEVAGKGDASWFCAYAPADDPTYVIACVVEEGGYGTDAALFGVRDALGGIYGEPDDSDVATSSTIR